MTGTPIEQPGEPAEEITPVEIEWWTDTLCLVWVAVRDTGGAEISELGVDVSEVVTVTALGGGVHLTRSFAEAACFWVWSPEQARVQAREVLGCADVEMAVALERAAALAEGIAR